ncbi:RICIN domain-containing protein [Streptomyces cyaneofuscatus]|uniref:RICIN domain-containing protein n=1 Tax=Streptomyces cyaneofuscatus TaxID=66883 RepID=UPI00332446A3
MKNLRTALLAGVLTAGVLIAPAASAAPHAPGAERNLVFKNVDTGNCLDRNVDNQAVASKCDGSASQQWSLLETDNKNGTVLLRNADNALCLHTGLALSDCRTDYLYNQWILSRGDAEGKGLIGSLDYNGGGLLENAEGETLDLSQWDFSAHHHEWIQSYAD